MTGVREFPEFQNVVSEGLRARGTMVFDKWSPFGLLLCFLPYVTKSQQFPECVIKSSSAAHKTAQPTLRHGR